MTRQELTDYIFDTWSVEPDCPFPMDDVTCVFRHTDNRKWFGIIMVIPGNKLGLNTDQSLDIIDLKFDSGEALDFANNTPNIFPGWHMNKRNWITLVLDDRMPDEAVFALINKSFMLADQK